MKPVTLRQAIKNVMKVFPGTEVFPGALPQKRSRKKAVKGRSRSTSASRSAT